MQRKCTWLKNLFAKERKFCNKIGKKFAKEL